MTKCIHGKGIIETCILCELINAQEASEQEAPTDNVRLFTGVTSLPLDPDLMLKKAVGHTTTVVIIGWDKEGNLFFSSSEPAGPEVLWLLEKAKQALLEIGG